MEQIIERTLEDWFPSGQATVTGVFGKVRDIPYGISAGMYDPREGPRAMLKSGKGSCVPKHFFLGEAFRSLGLGTRYSVFSFRWRDALPGAAAERLALKIPVTYHLALRAMIHGEWRLVDATWDKGLERTGLPVNLDWDGASDTVCAVKGIDERQFDDLTRCDAFLKERISAYSPRETIALARFSAGLNAWLEEARTGRGGR